MPRRLKLFRVVAVYLVLLVFFRVLELTRYTGSRAQERSISTTPGIRVLLVSALFPLEHSKHSDDDYRDWLARFLGTSGIDCDVYFYTTPTLEPLVRSLHESSNHTRILTLNTTYTTPFAIPPLAAHWAKYVQMHAWDRERDIHSPELYAVWNAKPWLLEQALLHLGDSLGVSYDYAFWNDAGSFRDPHAFGAWPDPERVDHVFTSASKAAGERKEDMIFVPIMKLPTMREYAWTADMGPMNIDFGEGSFFGSTPTGVSWFSRAFYAQHNHYISTVPPPPPPGWHHPHAPASEKPRLRPPFHFVGKDQTLINTLMVRHPARFFGVVSPKRARQLPPRPTSVGHLVAALLRTPPLPQLRIFSSKLVVRIKEELGERCVDEWYYDQWWLAARTARRSTETVRKWRRWKVGWGREGEGCEETRLVGVKELLEGLFGPSWVEHRRAREGDDF
ncbi:hypothetical protein FPV67DRAFT_1676111 [Lyophyllum atratum]|nr:hypothetical protein FPV67DRAFT_1676111 [Lyophyllum atratum]